MQQMIERAANFGSTLVPAPVKRSSDADSKSKACNRNPEKNARTAKFQAEGKNDFLTQFTAIIGLRTV